MPQQTEVVSFSVWSEKLLRCMLQDWTIRSWDLDAEHTTVLYSPASADRKQDRPASGAAVQAHIALTPMKPWLFFAAHMRSSVNGEPLRCQFHDWHTLASWHS